MTESRREFLKNACGALSMAALATQMQHFGAISAFAQRRGDLMAAQPEGGDAEAGEYRALVLVFWSGGNDGNNTVIPNHNDGSVSNYAAYNAARGAQGLAIAQNQLLPISVPRIGGLTYGLHPAFGPVSGGNNGIHELWAQQKLAVVTNCGTLVKPTTKQQYQQRTVPMPYQLFSHSDQVAQFQTGISTTQAFTGWGGRVADKMNAGSNPGGLIPMITSISGAQLFTAGQVTLPLAISQANNTGAPNLANVLNPSGFSGSTASLARKAAFNDLRTIDLQNNFVKEASHVTDLAMTANAALQTSQEVTVAFPNTSIGLQLKQVARLVKKRTDLSVKRQIFYCQIGGFDTHNNQVTSQANLLSQFSQAARAFYDEMVAQGVSQDVTLFSLSDFGRTFNPAGSGGVVGSDHAWGNHMFVLGGSVVGGNFYGVNTANGTPFPTLTMGTSGPDDTDNGSSGRGRWIPTTSVDQYANTLARWFGLPQDATTLRTVFPNLTNFAQTNLGFLP